MGRKAPSRRNGALADGPAPGGWALLVVDMISAWDFPDADKLLPGAQAITRPLSALCRRARAVHVPVIYANDNRGRWRSDFPSLVELSVAKGGAGAAITQALMPEPEDYFVLKPHLSGFSGTPLALLLQHLQARRIIVTGVASDQCILATVADARMHALEVVVPRDCVATQTARRQAMVLEQFQAVFRVATTPGSRIRLPARR